MYLCCCFFKKTKMKSFIIKREAGGLLHNVLSPPRTHWPTQGYTIWWMQRTVKIFLYESRISIFSFLGKSHQVLGSHDEEMSPHSRRPEQKYTVVEMYAAFDLFSSFSHHVIHSSSNSTTLWCFTVVYSQPFFTAASTPPCYHRVFFFPLSADSFVTVTQVHCGQTEGGKIDASSPRTGLKIPTTAKEIESSLFLNWRADLPQKGHIRLRFSTSNCKDGEILRALVVVFL